MLNSSFRKAMVTLSVLLCIAGCLADLVLLYVFGNHIPGYSQMTCTISSMGISGSPVSLAFSIWSVILGVFFIFFGLGFREVFQKGGKSSRNASWLIITYGLGEGIASGVFKADHINGSLTIISLMHNVLGGIGVIAVILLPMVMMKIFRHGLFPLFYRFSQVVWGIGLIFILLFSLRILFHEDSIIYTCKGLWQRIFLVDYYLYFTVIAVLVLKKLNNRIEFA
jgi:hypothetical protein